MRNGIYSALTFSVLIHLLIVLLIALTQSTDIPKFKQLQQPKPMIKSFLYRAPKVTSNANVAPEIRPIADEKVIEVTETTVLKKQNTEDKVDKPLIERETIKPPTKPSPSEELIVNSKEVQNANLLPPAILKPATESPSKPPQIPSKKLDSFTQLQRLRSRVNSAPSANPYQTYQPPSAFNTSPNTVPHSVPIKDEEKEREKNTKNMGAGIAITKSDDGTCSVTQDMSVYGLSEGSSTQYFICGESKFDKSFREHMKKVKTKLGK